MEVFMGSPSCKKAQGKQARTQCAEALPVFYTAGATNL